MAHSSGLSTRSDVEEDLTDDIPLHHKRPFGAGLSRQKVTFVAASNGESASSNPIKPAEYQNIGDLYLSMVLSKKEGETADRSTAIESLTAGSATDEGVERQHKIAQVCSVCKLPLTASTVAVSGSSTSPYPQNTHATSLAHQVCLTHSHPPSHLSRTRMGLLHLTSQGWDPDARQGLGADGQGILHPLQAEVKRDRLGVGVALLQKEDDGDFADEREKRGEGGRREAQGPTKKLDAKKVRKVVVEDKKRAERLREELFGNADLDKYLGHSGSGGNINLESILPRKGMKRKHGISCFSLQG
jgi:hypothetical protein